MLNERAERFCQAVASGETLTAAYLAAGYRWSGKRSGLRVEASRLRNRPDVSNRIYQIMEETRKNWKYTREWLLEQLEAAHNDARENKHSGAQVSALSVMTRILGEDKQNLNIEDTRLDHMDEKPAAFRSKRYDIAELVEAARTDPVVAKAIERADQHLKDASDDLVDQMIAQGRAQGEIREAMKAHEQNETTASAS